MQREQLKEAQSKHEGMHVLYFWIAGRMDLHMKVHPAHM
jgi:hypothetical protein